MPKTPHKTSRVLHLSELSNRHVTPFELAVSGEDSARLQQELGLLGLRKLRFVGQIAPVRAAGWDLTAELGATAIQPCVVTLDPVTTRIDTSLRRRYVPHHEVPAAGAETEMPEDDTIEPLVETIDLFEILAEALALALPDYPRSATAALTQSGFAPEGVAPMTDQETKPFAALQALRDKLNTKDE